MEETSYHYQSKFAHNLPVALTFDDVLLLPQHSEVTSRSQCNVKSRFSKNIPLNIPITSSPMDTVTEYKLAKEMARQGGIGIIHRFMSIQDQANEVAKVKRAQAHIVLDPQFVHPETTFAQLKELVDEFGFATFLVTEKIVRKDSEDEVKEENLSVNNKRPGSPFKKKSAQIYQDRALSKLLGIITKRDIKLFKDPAETVAQFMTKREKMTVFQVESFEHFQEHLHTEEILAKMYDARVEKIPIIDSNDGIIGLMTKKDIERHKVTPLANLDENGQLYVGAAVGANKDYLERAKALVEAGCNVLVVDVANGHSTICIEAVKTLKKTFPEVDIVAGSVATGEGALNLIKAGADGIRCGIGNGSICITRIVAGAGVPQLSAVMDVAPVCKEFGIPLISDGGNKCSGNMAKALAAGADCIMVGRLVAGTDESPSSIIFRDGKLQKVYRGMAGYGANVAKAKRTGETLPETDKFNPEGVEGYTPYSGPLKGVLGQFVQGIKSGMSYSGAFSIEEHQKKSKFIRITGSGQKESNVHSVNKIQ